MLEHSQLSDQSNRTAAQLRRVHVTQKESVRDRERMCEKTFNVADIHTEKHLYVHCETQNNECQGVLYRGDKSKQPSSQQQI